MYTQTNVGLLCCVGSGSNVAVPYEWSSCPRPVRRDAVQGRTVAPLRRNTTASTLRYHFEDKPVDVGKSSVFIVSVMLAYCLEGSLSRWCITAGVSKV